MRRLEVQTDLATAPLYYIGIHRVIHQPGGGSFSTWTLVGFENPANFTNIVQTSGFSPSATSTAPTLVNGTSDAPTGPCPNGNPEPKTVCTLESMRVTFNVTATQSIAASLARHASVTTEVAVPTIRLTYTP